MTKKQYQKFYESEIWEEAYELQKQAFVFSALLPKTESYGLVSQINRSSNSVCANLAEEHGRFHYADKIRVLYIVRGEIQETQSHLIVSTSRQYLKKEEVFELIEKYEILKIRVNGRIKNFYAKKS